VSDFVTIATGISVGLLVGLVTALLGYFKSEKPENFDGKKFALTLLIGVIVGGIAGGSGLSYDEAYAWAATAGILVWTEFFGKALIRRWTTQSR
jgi:ABC-type xylose transport system permease subunit